MSNKLFVLKKKEINLSRLISKLKKNNNDDLYLLDLQGNFNFNIPKNLNVKILSTHSEFEKIIAEVPENIIEIFKKIAKYNHDFYKYKIVEMNFADELWVNYIQFNLLKKIYNLYKIDKIEVETDNYFFKLRVNKLFNNINFYQKINYSIIFKFYQLSYKIRFVKYFFINLFKEIVVNLFYKKKKIYNARVIINSYNSNWINNSKNELYYRLSGDLNYDYMKQNKIRYMTSILRSNKINYSSFSKINAFFQKIKNEPRILILENYLSFYDIIKSSFKIKFFSNKTYKKIIKYFDEFIHLDIYRAVNSYNIVEAYNNDIYEKSYLTYIKNNSNLKKIFIPIFELTNGKILTKLSNQFHVNSYGMQQGSLGIFHKWRFLYNMYFQYLLNKDNIPTTILLEGHVSKSWFDEFKIYNTKIIGAPRVSKKIIKYENKLNSNTYIVILDMHNNEIYMRYLNDLSLKYKHKIFVIRPHPSKIQLFRKFKQKYNLLNVFIDDSNDINNTLQKYKPVLALFSQSGYITEFMLSEWPCLILKINGLPNYSPALLDDKISDLLLYDIHRDDLNNLNFLIKIINASKKISAKHLYTVGDESITILKKLMKN